MATVIDHILAGETHKATTLIETLLKQKTLEFINEAKTEVAESVYGGLEEGEYDDGEEDLIEAKMVKCTEKTFPGCGCGGYHKESAQKEFQKTGKFKGVERILPKTRGKNQMYRGGFSEDVTEEYLTEISQAIPWPTRSKHISKYTKPKGDTGSTYTHPEGHKVEFHKDAEGNAGWTHTTKEGKSKSGKGMEIFIYI